MDTPPLLPRAKSLRFAFTLNLMLPGTGQLYLGQIALGLSYLLGFLACFIAMLAIFFRFYRQYVALATDGSLLEGDRLEQLSKAIPLELLIVLVVLASGICVASLVSLGLSRRTHQGPLAG